MMMDYSELTNLEINKLVAKKWGHEKIYFKDNSDWISFTPDPNAPEVNYCREASHAWPVITEYQIGLICFCVARHLWQATNYHGDEESIEFVDKNPLRAAMIVYLMMGDDDGR